ncbi:MAG: hypothetical protein AAF331_14200, partial [Pseudomonadota bacterium]
MLLLSFFTLLAATVGVQETYTRGWVEHARIMPDRLLMSAKLDSGAQTTSIHAEILAAGSADEVTDDPSLAEQLADTESDARAMLSIRMMDGPAPDDPPALEISPLEDAIETGQMPEMIT